MVSIIIGSVIIAIVVGIFIFSLVKTPDNLMGYYGLFYGLFSVVGLIAGVLFILGGTLWGWQF